MEELFGPSEILIVDDDRSAADILARRLKLRRFSVTIAEDGETAIAEIERRPPDLVLLDFCMPGHSGQVVLAHLRRRLSPLELPVILHSALEDKRLQRLAFEAGANDFIVKPADFELLADRIGFQLNARATFKAERREQARLRRRLDVRQRLGGDLLGHSEVAEALSRALDRNQMTLAYQPQYHLHHRRIRGLEALANWHSPEFPDIAPQQFVTIAEEHGLIGQLTHWTIEQAIHDHCALEVHGLAAPIAINISAPLICDPNATERLLAHIGQNTHRITLELTETAIIQDPEEALRNLEMLSNAGVHISVDNYGTGWSSLAYLQRLPVREIKIDRTFIAHLTRSHRDPLLVRSTIELAHALELQVVAEGVEDIETLALLRAMGCDIVQGGFVAAPMPFESVRHFLGDRSTIAKLAEGPSTMELFTAAVKA